MSNLTAGHSRYRTRLRTFKVCFLAWAVFAFVVLFELPLFASTFAENPYSANLLLKEVGHTPKLCGKVMVAGSKARLDVDLGVPGVFRAILLADEKTLIVISDALKGYVTLPLTGNERDLRDVAIQAAHSIMPANVAVMEIQEGERKSIGTKNWQGWTASVSQSRFIVRSMSTESALSLEVWDNKALTPFPLRVVNMGGSEGKNGDSVELVSINQSFKPTESTFVIPDGYTRYTSVLNLLLYAITGL